MFNIENDLGLAELSEREKDVLYAASLVANEYGEVSVSILQTHDLVRPIPRPTVYRAISRLGEKGLLSRVGSASSGRYQLHRGSKALLKDHQD